MTVLHEFDPRKGRTARPLARVWWRDTRGTVGFGEFMPLAEAEEAARQFGEQRDGVSYWVEVVGWSVAAIEETLREIESL